MKARAETHASSPARWGMSENPRLTIGASLSASRTFLKRPTRRRRSPSSKRSRRKGAGCTKLRDELARPHDRSGEELREEGQKTGKQREVPDRLELAPVAVDGVAHPDEDVEGNAHREQDLEGVELPCSPQHPDQVRAGVQEEICVLEVPQEAQVQGDRDPDAHRPSRRPPVHPQPGDIVDDRHEKQKRSILRDRTHVEEVADPQEPPLPEPEGKKPEPGDRSGEEHGECSAVEEHGRSVRRCCLRRDGGAPRRQKVAVPEPFQQNLSEGSSPLGAQVEIV